MPVLKGLDRRQIIKLLSLALAANGRTARSLAAEGSLRWGIDYGATTNPEIACKFDLLVLDPDHSRPIEPLRAPHGVLLGYMSLGEVHHGRPYFEDLKSSGVLGQANPNWPGAYFADLRSSKWRDTVLSRIVPEILSKGYNGIFIDTADNAEAMERAAPQANAGMIAAAAAMVRDIRKRYPAMKIMLNRGYAILPDVATSIDYILAESMASRWNFVRKQYELLSQDDWEWQASRLRAARSLNPGLAAMTLDYWEPSEDRQVLALYARERAAGFHPYVATLALDRLMPEPGG
ncbi:endo alpha-1,4 polygalactosaminidase [Novosphingobium cyanobacteriorum]|nr:endo alpha-1,4 polygalactosaminidase [Novosphingobium cyanobacteriorum]